MIILAIIAFAVISFTATAILCAIIGSLDIITDEKDQKKASCIIFIVIFVLLLTGVDTSGPMAHMFRL